MAIGELLEVRCCCSPNKLLGWIRLPPNVPANAGRRFKVAMRPERLGLDPIEYLDLEVAKLRLPAEDYYETGKTYQILAVKDNGATIQQLRRCGAFKETP